MTFVWTSDLSVGVDAIDLQHQELFLRTNSLLVAIGDRRAEGEILTTLAFLGDYVVSHFEDEERLMQAAGYPGLAEHVAEHGRLTKAFDRLRRKFALGGIDELLVEDVERELCAWLVHHVQGTDRALGGWVLRGRGGGH
jgi:hemerythrin